MSRFVRLSRSVVLDKTRILGVRKDTTTWTKRPMIRVQEYREYEYDCHSYFARPMWYWVKIKYDTELDRDAMYEKLKAFVPDNVPASLIIDDLE